MLKRRIACILLIVAALILYLFDNETVTLALLVALIVMPAVSIGMLALSGRDLKISLAASPNTGENPIIRVSMENPNLVPLAAVEVEAICENLRTGETDSCFITDTPRPRGKKDIDLEIMPRNAGRYKISVASAILTDPLKLHSRKINCNGCEYMTIMPKKFDMQLSYTSDAAMLESDMSVYARKGNDPGDVRGIREYVAGDSVKNIHWKLSEKMDKMLVKELGTAIADQFLVILDTAFEISQDPVALEATASVFVSLIETLRQNASGLSIAWTDPETGRAIIRKIQDDEDLEKAADEYLAVPAITHSAFEHIERDIAESRYAHIVIVGSRVPDGIEAIANGCQVTLLLYGTPNVLTENNITIVGFEAGTCESDLAGIEI